MDEGIKHDSEKPRMDLLSASWIEGVARVLTFGAKKYAAHNWRNGLANSRTIGAALRHIFAYMGGEDNDSETNLCHLYHASCCLMFASELHFTRPDLDDRYNEKKFDRAREQFQPIDERKESLDRILNEKSPGANDFGLIKYQGKAPTLECAAFYQKFQCRNGRYEFYTHFLNTAKLGQVECENCGLRWNPG